MLLSLPPEIRLQIYENVIQPEKPTKLVFAIDHPVPAALSLLSMAPRTFGDSSITEWLIFTRKFPPVTIHVPVVQNDGTVTRHRLRVHRSRRPDTALLRVNRQLYQEVAPVLWKSTQLDFTQAFTALIPFANMLSPFARLQLSHLILRAPLHQTTDQAHWATTCSFINSQLQPWSLTVEYRYRSGTHWTTQQWHQKLALDPQTRRPSDPALRAALEFGADALMSWDDVLQFDDDDESPKDIEFLEGLQIESEDEMRESLGITKAREEPLDSSLAALSKIQGLKSLELKLIGGGLAHTIGAELDQYMKGKMLRKN
ncbi:hypothetical protein UCRPC4_g02957 [Phaeomoniella chlamydospora]|uniref:Uncharacterized protein n=1 Tax=Phaeomoniella chlamydospora TaxID=158046 RepID=A0A0G2ELK2_PHACM|nr:hypothetical protein UCRPC4_g02957 [Phaeomoniella chlamydospora]